MWHYIRKEWKLPKNGQFILFPHLGIIWNAEFWDLTIWNIRKYHSQNYCTIECRIWKIWGLSFLKSPPSIMPRGIKVKYWDFCLQTQKFSLKSIYFCPRQDKLCNTENESFSLLLKSRIWSLDWALNSQISSFKNSPYVFLALQRLMRDSKRGKSQKLRGLLTFRNEGKEKVKRLLNRAVTECNWRLARLSHLEYLRSIWLVKECCK